MLVSHRERTVEVWTRAEGEWSRALPREGDRARLASIGAVLDVAELYTAAEEPRS